MIKALLTEADPLYVEGAVNVFNCTNSCQEFHFKTGKYKIEAWGARGGRTVDTYNCGNGSYVKGVLTIDKAQDEFIGYLYVGGTTNSLRSPVYNNNNITTDKLSGGGASDIRLIKCFDQYSNESLSSRILVAGAGGAAGANNTSSIKGDGGALIGYSPDPSIINAEQTFAGYNTLASKEYYGSFGKGSSKGNTGGSGYFGGASSDNPLIGGSGGSSYISGYEGCKSTVSDIDLSITPSNIHYSNITFTEIEIKSGRDEIPSVINPEELSLGNNFEGCIKITILESQGYTKKKWITL